MALGLWTYSYAAIGTGAGTPGDGIRDAIMTYERAGWTVTWIGEVLGTTSVQVHAKKFNRTGVAEVDPNGAGNEATSD
jgi:hypothetical protein